MSAKLLYRVASVLFVLFALGHTAGFLNFRAPTPEAAAVYESMNAVQFQAGGGTFTYGGFYRGFGLSITVYLLFSAFLAWNLGNLASAFPAGATPIGWAFFAMQAVSFVLSWQYFSVAPAIFSAVAAICLAAGTFLAQRQPQVDGYLSESTGML